MFNVLASKKALAGLFAVIAVVGLLLGLSQLLAHPTEGEAREIVFGELLRFETLHGEPHVVFEHNDRIYFDELERDYKYLISQQSPGWVMTGAWYFIPATDDEAATVGVARCTGVLGEACGKETELFGQINAREVEALEVEYDGEWLRFSVEAPGYAVRLDGRHEVPTAYRWLDANGVIVHEEGYVEPLTPGRD